MDTALLLILLAQDPAKPAELVERLAHDDIEVRQAAERALLDMGEGALPAVIAAQRNATAEVAARLAQLKQRLEWWTRIAWDGHCAVDVMRGVLVWEGPSDVRSSIATERYVYIQLALGQVEKRLLRDGVVQWSTAKSDAESACNFGGELLETGSGLLQVSRERARHLSAEGQLLWATTVAPPAHLSNQRVHVLGDFCVIRGQDKTRVLALSNGMERFELDGAFIDARLVKGGLIVSTNDSATLYDLSTKQKTWTVNVRCGSQGGRIDVAGPYCFLQALSADEPATAAIKHETGALDHTLPGALHALHRAPDDSRATLLVGKKALDLQDNGALASGSEDFQRPVNRACGDDRMLFAVGLIPGCSTATVRAMTRDSLKEQWSYAVRSVSRTACLRGSDLTIRRLGSYIILQGSTSESRFVETLSATSGQPVSQWTSK